MDDSIQFDGELIILEQPQPKPKPKQDSIRSLRPSTKRIVYKVCFMTCLHNFGIGISNAAMLKVIIDNINGAQQMTFVYTIATSIMAAANVLLYPIRSHCADHFGRKPSFYISISGFLVSAIMLAVYSSLYSVFAAQLLRTTLSIFGTTIFSMLGEILPSQPHILSQVIAYMSVLTTIIYGIGFAVSVAILYQEIYTFVPFVLQAVFSLLTLISITTLPETLNKDLSKDIKMDMNSDQDVTDSYLLASTQPFSWNIFKSIWFYVKILCIDERIKWLTIADFVETIGSAGGVGALSAFVIEKFEWGNRNIVILLFVMAVCEGISSLSAGQLHKLLKSYNLMKISLCWGGLMVMIAALSPNPQCLYATLLLSVPLGWQFGLARDAFLLSITPSMFQARINSAGKITSEIAVAVFANLHSLVFLYFTSDSAFIYFPGASLLLGGLLRCAALPCVIRARIQSTSSSRDVPLPV